MMIYSSAGSTASPPLLAMMVPAMTISRTVHSTKIHFIPLPTNEPESAVPAGCPSHRMVAPVVVVPRAEATPSSLGGVGNTFSMSFFSLLARCIPDCLLTRGRDVGAATTDELRAFHTKILAPRGSRSVMLVAAGATPLV